MILSGVHLVLDEQRERSIALLALIGPSVGVDLEMVHERRLSGKRFQTGAVLTLKGAFV